MMKYFSLLLVCIVLSMTYSVAQEEGDPKETEDWRRKPEKVSPATCNSAPSDAIVLFDGTNLDNWESDKEGEAPWKVYGSSFTVIPKTGGIHTKDAFGDCQLHIEWRSPIDDVRQGKKDQNCGNSGIFLMGKYEVQVLNSFDNETYYNGMAGSIYKQHIPLVNPTKPVGEWQCYDIVFTAPRFNDDKSLKSPGYLTVFLNGVLVQNHAELKGPTKYIGQPSYKHHQDTLPIYLQDHGSEVSYRNIWVRRL